MLPLNRISYETQIIIKKFLVNRKETKNLLKKKEKKPNKVLTHSKVREFDFNKFYFECLFFQWWQVIKQNHFIFVWLSHVKWNQTDFSHLMFIRNSVLFDGISRSLTARKLTVETYVLVLYLGRNDSIVHR